MGRVAEALVGDLAIGGSNLPEEARFLRVSLLLHGFKSHLLHVEFRVHSVVVSMVAWEIPNL